MLLQPQKIMGYCVCFIMVLVLFGSQNAVASVSAYLDRNPVGLDTSFSLNFEVIGSAGTPDFSPLQQDFDILNQQQSSNISIVNGNFSRKQQWQLHLMPKEVGHFVIPPIAFGQQSSQQISIDVVEEQSYSASNRDIFIEVSVDTVKPYVQQQVLMHVKLYRAVNIGKATLSDPEHDNMIIKKLGEDRHGETDMHSRRYLLVERTYALFPQQSGKVVLPAISFEGQVMQYNGQLQTRRVRSQSIELDVQAIPPHVLVDWLPVKKLELTEAWPDQTPELEVGQALTRTIELRAQGASAAQLPAIILQASQHIKIYPDKAKLDDDISTDGLLGSRMQSIALVASKAGHVQLPSIDIPWWNTQTQQMEVAHLPARTINIKAAPTQAQIPTTMPTPRTKTIEQPNKTSTQPETQSFWIYSTIGITFLWLLTLFFWWRIASTKHLEKKENLTKQVSNKEVLNILQQACANKDAKACRTALLQWANTVWPHNGIHNLGVLRRYLDPQAGKSVAELEAVLFSAQDCAWDAQTLYLNIKKHQVSTEETKNNSYAVQAL